MKIRKIRNWDRGLQNRQKHAELVNGGWLDQSYRQITTSSLVNHPTELLTPTMTSEEDKNNKQQQNKQNKTRKPQKKANKQQ